MNFSIKATIRAFVAPKHRLSCERRIWRGLISELERRGGRRHESGVFLLGVERGERREVRDVVFYDDLDPHAYDTGVCILHGGSFAKLWEICRNRGLTVVADAHTHPGAAIQSGSDKANPMVARTGHIAIIIPDFARWPIRHGEIGIYEYCGEHNWIDRNATRSPGYLYTGIWS
jgi:hypothetical protein